MNVIIAACAALLLLALTGCNYTSEADEQWQRAHENAAPLWKRIKAELLPPRARVVPRGAKPEIIVQGDRVTYDGHVLGLGVPLQAWLDALPSPNRKGGNQYYSALVWDDLGLSLIARTEPGMPTRSWPVRIIDVQLANDVYIPSLMIVPATNRAFTGYLQIDGVGIDTRTTIDDWNRLSLAMPHPVDLRCSIPTPSWCSDIEHRPPLYIYRDKAAQKIERISIGS